MPSIDQRTRSWFEKFRGAFRGLGAGVRGQRSFLVHFSMTAAVLLMAGAVQVSLTEGCILLLCICVVLAAEMFNTSIECMAKAVSDQYHPQLADALDIASGAVLTTAIGASVIGIVILGNRLLSFCFFKLLTALVRPTVHLTWVQFGHHLHTVEIK